MIPMNCKTAIQYNYRRGKLTINEKARVRLRFNEYGKIFSGISLYLQERDDELAKRIFIEHMEERVEKTKKEFENATEYLRILKEEL